MAKPGQARPAGFVVAGVSPRLAFNDDYQGLPRPARRPRRHRRRQRTGLRGGAAAGRGAGRTRPGQDRLLLERQPRVPHAADAHARARSRTLLAGARRPSAAAQRERLEVVNRNGLRLLRLVNTLLDFSRIEAGRVRAAYEPTDLAAFTADLASIFRSACEKAGLRLAVDCPPLGEPVFVDREMWEKVVLNLLSNAFKFTFEGEIAVSLRQAGRRRRTAGAGHRHGHPRRGDAPAVRAVPPGRERTGPDPRGQRDRAGPGAGTGQAARRLHHRRERRRRGTTFIVSVPLGSDHLPRDQIGSRRTRVSPTAGASPFVEEALRWLPGRRQIPTISIPIAPTCRTTCRPRVAAPAPTPTGPVCWWPTTTPTCGSTSSGCWPISTASKPYRTARRRWRRCGGDLPDLILSDVMMPRLDGFGLLRELRADPRTASVPVIMLSARAGEESRVEGMEAGADDYLVKPFSARELLARVGALLQIARLRRESERVDPAERGAVPRPLRDDDRGICDRRDHLR